MVTDENEPGRERLERIIGQEILPKLPKLAGNQPKDFIELLTQYCKLRPVTKDQFLEESQDFEDGKLFYILGGIARTSYYAQDHDKLVISRIWKKGEVIFDVNSFQNEVDRAERIQMLEDGEVLTVSYTSLKKLMAAYPNMVSFLLCLQAEREKHYRFYQHLLKLTVDERVAMYLNHNPGIDNRINKDCIALHLGISRSKFSDAYSQYKQQKATMPI